MWSQLLRWLEHKWPLLTCLKHCIQYTLPLIFFLSWCTQFFFFGEYVYAVSQLHMAFSLFASEALAILAIPIVEESEDFLAWHPDNRGIFSVKSAYKLHIDLLLKHSSSAECSLGDNREWRQKVWKQIWKLKCPPKLQHFLWRFGHNSHPLRMNIGRRGVELDTRCVICNRLFEDGGHLFLRCKEVKACWRVLELEDVRTQLCACPSPLQLLEKVFALLAETKLRVIALLWCWCWWTERNKVNHQERRLGVEEFRFLILRLTAEWKEHLEKEIMVPARPTRCWLPPPVDVIKINVDGSSLDNSNTGGWGAIGRNHTGEPVFAACGRIPAAAEALQTELLALIHVIPVAEQLGIGRVIISTDCTKLKHAIETSAYDLSRLGPLFMQAKYLCPGWVLSSCKQSIFVQAGSSLHASKVSHAHGLINYSVEYCPRACQLGITVAHLPVYLKTLHLLTRLSKLLQLTSLTVGLISRRQARYSSEKLHHTTNRVEWTTSTSQQATPSGS
uniref:Uncharacterized protein n=1 Tax=Avena sativa TaxID=4498 RepID=A0ACD5UXI4_AVESA